MESEDVLFNDVHTSAVLASGRAARLRASLGPSTSPPSKRLLFGAPALRGPLLFVGL